MLKRLHRFLLLINLIFFFCRAILEDAAVYVGGEVVQLNFFLTQPESAGPHLMQGSKETLGTFRFGTWLARDSAWKRDFDKAVG